MLFYSALWGLFLCSFESLGSEPQPPKRKSEGYVALHPGERRKKIKTAEESSKITSTTQLPKQLFEQLPKDPLFHIFSFLIGSIHNRSHWNDLVQCSGTNRYLHCHVQEWIEEEIRRSKMWDLFKHVVKLYEIAKRVADESYAQKKIKITIGGYEAQEWVDYPFNCSNQGIGLIFVDYAIFILAPWGKLTLCSSSMSQDWMTVAKRFLNEKTLVYSCPQVQFPSKICFIREIDGVFIETCKPLLFSTKKSSHPEETPEYLLYKKRRWQWKLMCNFLRQKHGVLTSKILTSEMPINRITTSKEPVAPGTPVSKISTSVGVGTRQHKCARLRCSIL